MKWKNEELIQISSSARQLKPYKKRGMWCLGNLKHNKYKIFDTVYIDFFLRKLREFMSSSPKPQGKTKSHNLGLRTRNF